jgi:uncharacterized protein (DUF983 family)
MEPRCTGCGLRFEREPGYFLGSIYLNYGVAILVGVVLHLVMEAGLQRSLAVQVPILACSVLAVALATFRHARALWLAFDLACDPPHAEELAPPAIPTPGPAPASSPPAR